MPRSRRSTSKARGDAHADQRPCDGMSAFRQQLIVEKGERLLRSGEERERVAQALMRLTVDECLPVHAALVSGSISVADAVEQILELARDVRRPTAIPKWWAGE